MSDSEELMQDQDRIEAYKQLKDRCDQLGYASVNHALDDLEQFNALMALPTEWGCQLLKAAGNARII
jgi:hypothetical protein